MKKIFILSLALLILTIVFLVVYNFVFKKTIAQNEDQTPQEITDQGTTTIREPIAEVSKISKIVTGSVLSSALISDDALLYVEKFSGKIMRTRTSGSEPEVAFNPAVGSVSRVAWHDDGNSVILTTKDNNNFSIDLIGLKTRLFNQRPDYVVWAQDNAKVLYKKFDETTGLRTLVLDSVGGEDPKVLATLPFRRISLDEIPGSFLATFWQEPDANTKSELYTVSTVSPGEPRRIFAELYGADYLISPDGSQILVSGAQEPNSNKSILGIMNRDGRDYRSLSTPTFVSKAVWSKDNKTIYFAQPTAIPTGSVLPNDYVRKEFTTRDTFWKIDITNGKKERLINLDELPGTIDATNLLVNDDETALFFINRTDDSLYRLNL